MLGLDWPGDHWGWSLGLNNWHTQIVTIINVNWITHTLCSVNFDPSVLRVTKKGV